MKENDRAACGHCATEQPVKDLQEIWSATENRFVTVCGTCLSQVANHFKREDDSMTTVTPDKFEHETYPQLTLLTSLMETYGGEISLWAEDADGETLALTSEGYLFVMKRDGELHVTRTGTDDVFFISDPSLEDVENMLASMEEDSEEHAD